MKPSSSTAIWNILRYFIGLALLALLVWRLGWTNLVSAFKASNLFYIPVLVVIFLVILFLNSIALHVLLIPVIPGIRCKESIIDYLYAWTIGCFLPSNIGQFSIVYFWHKRGLPTGSGLAITLLNKLGSLLWVAILGISGVLLFLPARQAMPSVLIFIGLCILFMFFLVVRPGRIFIRFIFKRFAGWFPGFYSSIDEYFVIHRRSLITSYLVVLCVWLVMGLNTLVVFKMFGIHISFWNVVTINAIVQLFALIPVSIAGLGLREGSAVFLYSLLGLPTATVGAAQIMLLFITYAICLVTLWPLSRTFGKASWQTIFSKLKTKPAR